VAQDVIVVGSAAPGFLGTVLVGDASLPASSRSDPDVGNQSDSVIAVTASCPDFAFDKPGLPADVHRTCMIVSCDGAT